MKEVTYSESEEIAGGFVIDFDINGVIGLDIDFASKLIDLKTLEAKGFPFHLQLVTPLVESMLTQIICHRLKT